MGTAAAAGNPEVGSLEEHRSCRRCVNKINRRFVAMEDERLLRVLHRRLVVVLLVRHDDGGLIVTRIRCEGGVVEIMRFEEDV